MSISASTATAAQPQPSFVFVSDDHPLRSQIIVQAQNPPSDCLPLVHSTVIPQPTAEIAKRAHEVACRIFPLAVPIWAQWGFCVFQLLKRVEPEMIVQWPFHFSLLKNAMPREAGSKTDFFDQPEIHKQQKLAIWFLEKYYQKLEQQSKKWKDSKEPQHLQKLSEYEDLLALLKMWQNNLRQNFTASSTTNDFSNASMYKKFREFVHFISEMSLQPSGASLHTRKFFKPATPSDNRESRQLHKLLPKKGNDFLKAHRKCITTLGIAYGDNSASFEIHNSACYFTRTGQVTDNKYQNCFENSYAGYAHARAHQVLLDSAIDYFSRKSSVNYTEAVNRVKQALERVFQTCCQTCDQSNPALKSQNKQPQKNNPEITAIAICTKLETTCQMKSSTILKTYRQMKESIKKEFLYDLFDPCKDLVEQDTLLAFLQLGKPFDLLHFVQDKITNLEYDLREILNLLRTENLALFSDLFRTVSPELLETHQDTILASMQTLHLIAAKPILDYFEMLLGVSFLTQETSPVMFTDNQTFSTNALPLARFIAFAGAKETLQRLKKELRKTQKPASSTSTITAAAPIDFPLVEGLSAPSTASAATAAQLEKEKMLATAAVSTVKKAKTKTRKKGHASAAASASATDKHEKTPEPTTASATAETETWMPTPTKTREMIQLLEEREYFFLRQGSDHTIFFNEAKGQKVAVPRHTTLANGTAASINQQTKK